MTEKKKDTVTISKLTLWKTITAVLAVLLIASVYSGGFGMGSDNGTADSAPAQVAQPRPQAPSAPTVEINIVDLMDEDAVKGDPNAPVTIVEFSDFECPFCTKFFTDTLGKIDTEYIQTGKVKFVYRDFPLGFHANAQKAAEAAECAGEQDSFWEMHDKLFEAGVSGGVSAFKQYANDLGLDTTEFDTCLDSGQMTAEVKADFSDAAEVGVGGTPMFFINSQKLSGAQPFANFKQVIDAELAK